MKSGKMLHIIYAHIEHLVRRIDECANSSEKSSTIKISRCKTMLHLWKKILKKFANDKNYWKLRDHCHIPSKYRGATHSICDLRFNLPNEIPAALHNGSNYDYHFIIKNLANEFENTGKYKAFAVPIEKKDTNIDKDGNGSVVTISYKIKFINGARFTASSL